VKSEEAEVEVKVEVEELYCIRAFVAKKLMYVSH